jgi:hypothetical protein
MIGIYVDTLEQMQTFNLNGYKISANLSIPMGAPAGGEVAGISSARKSASSAGGIVFATGTDEFLIVGKDFRLMFTPLDTNLSKPKIDIEYADEGSFVNGKWVRWRRLNGDEGTGGGDYGFGFNKGYVAYYRIPPTLTGEYPIVRFKVYRY